LLHRMWSSSSYFRQCVHDLECGSKPIDLTRRQFFDNRRGWKPAGR
jgi:hypothetical protein